MEFFGGINIRQKTSFILSFILILSLCSCGSKTSTEPSPSQQANTPNVTGKESVDTSTPVNSNVSPEGVQSNPSNDRTELTNLELAHYTSEFSRGYNTGFLLCDYSEPSEINLNVVLLYSGVDGYAEPDERAAYLQMTGKDKVEDTMSMSSTEINKLLEDKLNISLADVKSKFDWIYIDKFDTYYTEGTLPDNNNFIYCKNGYKTNDGDIVIHCICYGMIASCTVKIHTSGEGYVFVSNLTSKDEGSIATPNNQGKAELTPAELAWFTKYFWEYDNNCFLLSSYSKPNEIDLNTLLYNGGGIKDVTSFSEEEEAILRNQHGFEFDIIKLTTAQIDSLLKEKTGIKLSDVTTKLTYLYLKDYDAYYEDRSDFYFSDVYCFNGNRTDDETYVIQYVSMPGLNYLGSVTLKKSGEHFLFVSNTIAK